jgi:hypothetical protein
VPRQETLGSPRKLTAGALVDRKLRFAFGTRRIVSRSKIDNVVDDIVTLLDTRKVFPQEHLMSAGQLLLNQLRVLTLDRAERASRFSVSVIALQPLASGLR